MKALELLYPSDTRLFPSSDPSHTFAERPADRPPYGHRAAPGLSLTGFDKLLGSRCALHDRVMMNNLSKGGVLSELRAFLLAEAPLRHSYRLTESASELLQSDCDEVRVTMEYVPHQTLTGATMTRLPGAGLGWGRAVTSRSFGLLAVSFTSNSPPFRPTPFKKPSLVFLSYISLSLTTLLTDPQDPSPNPLPNRL